ncbi:MAG: hypothetical protein ACOYMB_01920 [Patescibacteria group bacterium]
MIGEMTKDYAIWLNRQGHGHPVIKTILIVMEVIAEVEKRKKSGDDFEKFLSTLGFDKESSQYLLSSSSIMCTGKGLVTNEDTTEILKLLDLKEEFVEPFKDYNIFIRIFSYKKSKENSFHSEKEVINSLSFSQEGRQVLIQMSDLFGDNVANLYYHYLNKRKY